MNCYESDEMLEIELEKKCAEWLKGWGICILSDGRCEGAENMKTYLKFCVWGENKNCLYAFINGLRAVLRDEGILRGETALI